MATQAQHGWGRSATIAVTLLAAGLGMAIPIVVAIILSARQGRETEMRLVSSYANESLRRSESTSDQALQATDALYATQAADPCSDSNLAVMRRFDLSSNYLQAVGYVANGRLVCSSLGREGTDLDLGPVDYVTPLGVRMRTNVRFPFDDAHTYVVAERHGYAVILNKDISFDTVTNEPDVSFAFFSSFNGHIMAAHGFISPGWIGAPQRAAPPRRSVRTFLDGSYVVAVALSDRYYLGAIAALPASYVAAPTRSTAMVLLPVGLAVGIALVYVMLRLLRQQAALPAMLRTALKRGEFFMAYQPVVDLQTGACVGAEALLRWRRANGEMMRPDLFIPAAEDAGMSQDITQHVARLVGRDLRGCLAHAPQFHIAINLTAIDLESGYTIDLLRRLARELQAGPGSLIAEVTERGLLKRELAQQVVRSLRESGMSVAIDDFGTGYSSLAYLESFEIDFLKIDKSFVDTLNLDAPTSQVALHIIEMAKSLNLRMVAEGVETQAQAAFLREHGVQYAQGRFFSEPLPVDELLRRALRRLPEAVRLPAALAG